MYFSQYPLTALEPYITGHLAGWAVWHGYVGAGTGYLKDKKIHHCNLSPPHQLDRKFDNPFFLPFGFKQIATDTVIGTSVLTS